MQGHSASCSSRSTAFSPGCQRASWFTAVEHEWQKATLLMLSGMCSLTVHRVFMHDLSCFTLRFGQKAAETMETSSPSCPKSVGWVYMLWPLRYLHTNSSPWKCHCNLSSARTRKAWQSNHLFTLREASLDCIREWRLPVYFDGPLVVNYNIT